MTEDDVYMHGFRINDIYYGHYINSKTDGTFIINEDKRKEKIFEVDHSGYSKLKGKNIGRFRYCFDQDEIWEFVFDDEKEGKVITGNKDLIKAEMKIFKILLDRGLV